jgi:hypothetical protein
LRPRIISTGRVNSRLPCGKQGATALYERQIVGVWYFAVIVIRGKIVVLLENVELAPNFSLKTGQGLARNIRAPQHSTGGHLYGRPST